jgi:uncharacterized protein (TIGR04255 family)
MTFDRPPLNEVVLSLQSESVKGFTTPYLGLFWGRIRDAYPETQTQPPLGPVVERFEGAPKPAPTVPFRVLETMETPRCWFLTRGGQQLVQVQQDRLILNWRRIQADDVYPRYERLRPELERVANELLLFLEQEGLGNVVPNQCEVSYINHIETAEWAQRGELHRVLSFWQRISATGLPDPEDATAALRFVMEEEGTKLGRLHVNLKSAARRSDSKPVLVLEVTARGKPLSADLKGALQFMDRGRDRIHRAFQALTSRDAQRELWGLRDE